MFWLVLNPPVIITPVCICFYVVVKIDFFSALKVLVFLGFIFTKVGKILFNVSKPINVQYMNLYRLFVVLKTFLTYCDQALEADETLQEKKEQQMNSQRVM